jgi:hypothetical protein
VVNGPLAALSLTRAALRIETDKIRVSTSRKEDIATQGEKSVKRIQEREARKMEKDLTARHKRQLDEMRGGDLERRQEADSQERDELHRQERLKTREAVRHLEKKHTDLSGAMAENEELVKAVKRWTATTETL